MGDQDTLDKLVAEGGRRVPKREKAEIGKQARKLKEVSVNLSYAGMAVSFVKQKVPLVANWDEILPASAEGVFGVGIDRAKSQKDAEEAEAASRTLVLCRTSTGGSESERKGLQKNAGTMSTKRIFTMVMPGKIIA